jgi:pyridinium-3,5-bisthiocarboxylic acid mononucleotide nickel chelatase
MVGRTFAGDVMRIAYFDCFSGVSGDMFLGALLDAGLSLERLKDELAKLQLSHYDLRTEKVSKQGIGGTRATVMVDADHHQHHRGLRQIREIIERSALQESIQRKSLEIFTRLAEAEAQVHQTSVEAVHFHEVGAMDAILDVVGAVIGLHCLGIEQVYCSPLHVGSGTVVCAHGTLPVPAPATAELLKGRPVYATGVVGELVTPTGAAILTTLSTGFGPMPSMIPERIGYGAGARELNIPNLLRVFIGESSGPAGDVEAECVAVLETSIDDMNPQLYEYIIGKILGLGALDIFLTPVQMKKNRPGTLITVICQTGEIARFSDFLLRETTTIGLRWRVDQRLKARRRMQEVQTRFGPIRIKIASIGGRIVNVSPEYEDCKRLAQEKGIPLKDIMEEARLAASQVEIPRWSD